MGVSVLEGIRAQMALDCRPDASECWCRGSGWILSDWDSFHECRYHYDGQPNNESSDWEWERWMAMNSDAQFLIIEEDHDNYGQAWQWYANRISRQCEDIPF